MADGKRIVPVAGETGRWIQRTMNGVECDVHEERTVVFLTSGDDAFRLCREQVSRIAVFLNGLLIPMPVVNRKPGRSIVHDRLCEVVDAPGVVAVLMFEALAHRQMLGQPFTQMPLSD